MVKKSDSRVARDTYLADNRGWDDLNKTSAAVAETLQFELAALSLFFSQAPLMAYVPRDHQGQVTQALQALQADNAVLTQQFREIASKHTDKTGRIATKEEGWVAQQLFTAYMDVAARFEQTSTPLLTYLNGIRETVEAEVIKIEGEFEEERQRKLAAEAEAADAAAPAEPAADETATEQPPQA